ncbi:hypothetical protein BU24DRAFT_423811 [Aaosphaeria arxii CBS 175.79]|uniref:Uncharacterized protein n=1 Tax=Aaosphaeria arxii CBS 175.79 TaxID=1450172 RepID=A0A6A5XRH7_9PLEO|nr:uncharacterized protein BU24DRAFT_423811 [Aaosphaeria arxii CBS 175.79]KAF2014904.1 hypothetical protein BU24DRAFT_423811 [Aaosphaeria arxii CBS 175.79]
MVDFAMVWYGDGQGLVARLLDASCGMQRAVLASDPFGGAVPFSPWHQIPASPIHSPPILKGSEKSC